MKPETSTNIADANRVDSTGGSAKKLTLADYHKKYPARHGDTVEKFARYEEFCTKNPCPNGDGYFSWYARSAVWMESSPNSQK